MAVLVGFIFIYHQIRLNRQANSITLLNSLRNRWNSPHLVAARIYTCQSHLRCASQNASIKLQGAETELLSFLEDLASFVRYGAIPEYFAWSYYRWYVDLYWHISKNGIFAYRSEFKDDTWYEDLEWLKKKFDKITTRNRGTPIVGAAVESFVLEELNGLTTIYAILNKPDDNSK